MASPYALKIYIDGSFRRPGYRGGFAGIAEFPESLDLPTVSIFQHSYRSTTNNRMELAACIEAFKYVSSESHKLQLNHVVILTDSQYVHENQNRCINWKKSKWKNQHGRPIENSDLWDAFIKQRVKASAKAKIDIEWLKGKTIPENKAVDKLAKAASSVESTTLDKGFRPGRFTRSGSLEKGGATLYPANNQTITIKVYRDVRIANQIKVTFTVVNEQTGEIMNKYFAYTSPEYSGIIHRAHFYRVKFGGNPKLPLILEWQEID